MAIATAVVGAATACGDSDGEESPRPGGAPTASASPASAAGRLSVVTTIAQITALAREVGGERIDLHGLVPPGADSHAFEPVAEDLVAVENADLILRHGVGLDDWLDDTLSAARDATVVTVTDGIELRPPALQAEGEHDGEDGAGDHGDVDPHVWLDPERAKQMVDNIAEALAAADPAGADTYRANAAAYNAVLDDAAAEARALIDEIPEQDRKIVTNHDGFGYFAEAFGLEVVGAVIPSSTTGAEPSAQETAGLLRLIREEGVKAIFAESSVNSDLAETLARDAGVRIVDDLYVDALGEPGSGADTVDGVIVVNAQKVHEALGAGP
ncbi:MAG TPA: metal ABC transporter substrate-binding protein [Dehalococcoidia bacterium]|nr:metal ABC transporter substrate-binding protein [Dehalococcoidia bacterium]